MEEEKKLILKESEANEILQYLGNRPYKEVASLIMMIQVNWSRQNEAQEVPAVK